MTIILTHFKKKPLIFTHISLNLLHLLKLRHFLYILESLLTIWVREIAVLCSGIFVEVD